MRDWNRRDFINAGVFASFAGPAMLGLEGCPSATQWIQIALGLIPIALQTVGSLKFGSGSIPAALMATITEYSNLAGTVLKDVQADIKTAETTPGIIPKIDALLTNLEQQSQALIPQVTGNAGVLTWVQSILADALDIANLIPIITTTAASPTAAATTVYKAKVSLASAKSYQDVFKARLASVQTAQ